MVQAAGNSDVFPEASDIGVSGDPSSKSETRLPDSLPLWMVAGYLGLFVIRPWEQLFPRLAPIHFELIYAIAAILVAVFSRKTKMPGVSLQSITIFMFVIALALSGLLGISFSTSWPPFYEYLTQVVCYFLLMMSIRSYRDLQFILASYIGSMFLYLSKAQWEFFLNGQHRYDMGVMRMVGIEESFGGPNALAMSIVASMPFWFYLWKTRHDALWFNVSKHRRLYRNLLLGYLVLAISSTILTNSRSGMLAMALFVLMTALSGRGLKSKILLPISGMLFLTLIWVVMPESNRDRLRTVWDPESGPTNAEISAQGRIEGLKAGIAIFKRFPISGVGLGNFIDYRVAHIDGVSLNPHNLVGQILGETGILGAGAFLLLILAILYNSNVIKATCRRLSGSDSSGLSLLASACRNSVLLLLFEGIFGHNMTRYNWLWIAAFAVLALTFSKSLSEDGFDHDSDSLARGPGNMDLEEFRISR